jgi:hypothetical protein
MQIAIMDKHNWYGRIGNVSYATKIQSPVMYDGARSRSSRLEFPKASPQCLHWAVFGTFAGARYQQDASSFSHSDMPSPRQTSGLVAIPYVESLPLSRGRSTEE